MISKSFAVMGVLTLLSAAAHAGSAPKELYGKSIILTWGEHRNQRMFGEASFRDVNVALSRTIYISTKGQWFGRFAAGSQSHESIGTSGAPLGGGLREVQFSGRSITATSASKGGIARRMTIAAGEIRSATVPSVSCSVRDGNVFAQ
jgi:hypothetical protein